MNKIIEYIKYIIGYENFELFLSVSLFVIVLVCFFGCVIVYEIDKPSAEKRYKQEFCQKNKSVPNCLNISYDHIKEAEEVLKNRKKEKALSDIYNNITN